MQLLLPFLLAILAFFHTASASALPLPRATTGFVQTNGTRFSLDGSKFVVVGANAYWLGLAGLSEEDMDKVLVDVKKMGATTVRVWAFNDMPEEYLWIEGGIYYQIWQGNKATINYGPSGLGHFDRVVASAERNNLKLIVTLTSNYNADWVYGGIPAYLRGVLGNDYQTDLHEPFFTNPEIKAIYKNYITAVVNRYKDVSTIMSWELGHDLKCFRGWYPLFPRCYSKTITSWIEEMSSHIKSIDPNHLVAVGDDGFYDRKDDPVELPAFSPYNGFHGMDFDTNIALSTIDYGTYTDDAVNFTPEEKRWIEEHGRSQEKAQKPVVLSRVGNYVRRDVLNKVLEEGIAGTLYWQAGYDTDKIKLNMPYWYRGQDITSGGDAFALLTKHAEALKVRP